MHCWYYGTITNSPITILTKSLCVKVSKVGKQCKGAREAYSLKLVSWKGVMQKKFHTCAQYISITIHSTENLKVPADRTLKMQSFDIWYISVGQILLGLYQTECLDIEKLIICCCEMQFFLENSHFFNTMPFSITLM